MSWTPKETVIVPVDFSEASFAAIDTALELVEEPSHVHVLHVLPHAHPVDPDVLLPVPDEEAYRKEVARALERRLDDSRHAGAQAHVRSGDAGHEIVRYATAVDADLIVLSSHGHSGLKHLLLGSVAERVVRLAGCPVLVLRR